MTDENDHCSDTHDLVKKLGGTDEVVSRDDLGVGINAHILAKFPSEKNAKEFTNF